MSELILYTNPMSRGRIARWMMEEVGEPYETVILGYGEPMKNDEYRAINPMGKVPTLKHGDAIVTEAAAICAYMADAFPEKRLAPSPGDPDRGAYYRWLFFAAGPVEQAVTMKAQNFEVPKEKEATVGYGSYYAVLDTLEAHLKDHEYFAGESFSAADVYAGSQVMWGLQFGTFEKRPAFEAYAGRMAQRPAFQRASEIDNGLMEEQQG